MATLKRETVADVMAFFGRMYGNPQHVKTQEDAESMIDCFYDALVKVVDEDRFLDQCLPTAKLQARGFPRVADFFHNHQPPKVYKRDHI